MQNLQDDKFLDDLSRDAAERFETDPGMHSWDKLVPRLEVELPQKEEKKRRYLIIILLFLLVGGGVVTYGLLSDPERKTAKSDNATAVPDKTDASKEQTDKSDISRNTNTPNTNSSADQAKNPNQSDNATPVPDNSDKSADVSKSETDKSDNPQTNSTNPDNAQINKVGQTVKPDNAAVVPDKHTQGNKPQSNKSQGNKPQTNKSDKPLNSDKPLDKTVTQKTKGAKQPTVNEPAVVLLEDTRISMEPKAQGNKAQVDKVQGDKSQTDKSGKAIENPDNSNKQVSSEKQPDNAAVSKAQTDKVAKKQDNPKLKRWEIGLTYAPDISTVKFTHTQKPGTNYGLNIGYNISRRWQVNAGIIYTTKNYKMNGEDYHPPKGYWTDYVNLQEVEGSCDMWDIPVNVRYNIIPRKRSNFFASAGLSSYIMEKEDYDYYYTYGSNPNVVQRNRTYENVGNYWFSVVNLSIGYEKQIGKNISLQAEPFFKQPLKGVGFGNIKLNTTGIFFTGKYKF